MGFWEPLFFWVFALGAVASSLMVVIFRNPLYSALSLILDFFFFAGLYVLLSAHMMAITQILVYAGAIMVLFLFIIMLLNLKDEELGEFEFHLHHLLSFAAVLGLFFFLAQALSPLVDTEDVSKQREAAATAYEASVKTYEEALAKAEAAEGEEREKLLAEARALEPKYDVRTRSAVKGPLFADLSEDGLEGFWGRRVEAYKTGRSKPNQGKWRSFEPRATFDIPPAMTGDGLKTERGYIRPANKRPSFGTIEPMSVLIVNRFVVPFELTAFLLLAAIVGAVIIAKRRV